MDLVRVLQSQGFGSRAECRALIFNGRVRIDGHAIRDPAFDFSEDTLSFTVDEVEWVYRKFAYLVLNKPQDHECSHRPSHYPSIYSLLSTPLVRRGVQAVGRLDADTTGLLLLTDDGQFIHAFTSPKKEVGKCYEVFTRYPVTSEQMASLLSGVVLRDDPSPVHATQCELVSPLCLRMTVTEGKYHLVKRMIAAVSNRVERLNRISIGDYVLPVELAVGEWKWLSDADLRALGWTQAP